jgi:DNA-binding NtrC family response regulator/predicted hydrocarbon binding protein
MSGGEENVVKLQPPPVVEAGRDGHYPDVADLVSRVRFVPKEGRIWLDGQRMMLLHTSAFGILRRELIESMGVDRARGLLKRIGYNSGGRDAQVARRLRHDASLNDAIFVGPQLHMLEGVVAVEPVRLEIDKEHGRFYGEFLWHDSSEDEEHIRSYGIGAEPVCWMQIGYASGFVSTFMGRPVLFREVECRAQGFDHCRIVGKLADDWEGAEDELADMRADPVSRGLSVGPRGGTQVELHVAKTDAGLGDDDVVGISGGFNAVCHMVRRVADARTTVLFLGESGVGKEVLAQALHRISPRKDAAFVAINCAAIPEGLVEAELFGVEKGAYTGAQVSRPGRFERADGGTLFLDEIGILSPTAQGKLLRVLQEREVERVGDTKARKVDVRVVAATNLDLREQVKAGRFREDLFYRLNVFPIRVPPLRERRDDIPVFMNHFLRKFNRLNNREVTGFTGRAIDLMLNYQWPGNIRELENMMERGVVLAPNGGAIDVPHLFSGGEELPRDMLSLWSDGSLSASPALDLERVESTGDLAGRVSRKVSSLLHGIGDNEEQTSLDEIELALLQRAVQRTKGNLAAAARLLGITRPQLVYRLKSRGIEV